MSLKDRQANVLGCRTGDRSHVGGRHKGAGGPNLREMLGRALRGQRLRKEIDEEQMTIKCNPNSRLSRSRQGLAPAPGEPELVLTRRHSCSPGVATCSTTTTNRQLESFGLRKVNRRSQRIEGVADRPRHPRSGDRRSRGGTLKRLN